MNFQNIQIILRQFLKENQKRLLGTVNEEIEKMIEKGMWDKLERTEVLQKGHGRIEKVVFRMLSDTSFVYERLGLKSFYGTIARIGVMDKTVEMMKEGEEVRTKRRSIFITDIEDITVETMQKIRAAHWNIEMQHCWVRLQIPSYRIFHYKQEKSVLFFAARCKSYCFHVEILICGDCARL